MTAERPEFRLTFDPFRSNPHPAGDWVTSSGWVTVVVDTEMWAILLARGLFGQNWLRLYAVNLPARESTGLDPDAFHDLDWSVVFPHGELLRIEMPPRSKVVR